MAMGAPVGAQQFQRSLRQRHIAVVAAFALPHVHHPPATVDVGHLQRHAFPNAQAASIDGRQTGAIPRLVHAAQHARHFFYAQHRRQRLLLLSPRQVQQVPIALERMLVEKSETTQGDRHGAGRYRLLVLQVEQVPSHLFLANLIRRFAVELGQVLDHGEIRFLGARGEPAQLHVLGHPLAKNGHSGTSWVDEWIDGPHGYPTSG
jgi:hypothetical protein